MKIKWGKLLLCLALPLAVGGLSAFFTKGNMQLFETVEQPPLAPPAWLFPVAWTVLYLLMGFASYRVCMSEEGKEYKSRFWWLYGAQLFFNFFWSLIFFNLQAYLFAFFWLILLLALIVWMMCTARKIDKVAFWCLAPYPVWVIFAGYLNLGIALLN